MKQTGLGSKVVKAMEKNNELLVFANGRTLLNPHASHVSPNRGILDVAAEKQAIGVIDPEPAKIESLFSPGLLRSTFNHESGEERVVLKKIDKYMNGNKTSKSFIVYQNVDGSIGARELNKYVTLNEGFGFINNAEALDKKAGDILKPEEFFQHSINYTPAGVSRGKNYRTAYCISDETIEDSVLIADTVIDSFRYYTIHDISMVLDPNVGLFKDLYGSGDIYKPFPGVGEKVTKRDTFAAISHYNTAFQFIKPITNLRNISLNDTTYHIEDGSLVVDLEVLCAHKECVKDLYLKSLHDDTMKYYNDCFEALNDYYAKGMKLDIDAYYQYDRLVGITYRSNKTVGYRVDRHVIPEGHIIINATLYKEHKLEPGAKLTGRHGNKGVENTNETPLKIGGVFKYGTLVDENGEPVDIWLNTLGTINRSNPAQFYEKIDNRIYDAILNHFRKKKKDGTYNYKEFSEVLSTVTNLIAPEMYELTVEALPEEKLSYNDPEVLDDILVNDLIIYTNPWAQEEWNDMYKWNTLIRHLEVYKYLDGKGISIKKNKMYRKNLETGEMVYAGFDAEVSSMYFKFLEYTAKKKFVMRMMGAYDNKGALTKTKDKKEYKSRFGDTPVKVGERDIAVIASIIGIENVETVHQFLTQTDSDVVNTMIAFFKVMGVELKVDDEIQERLSKYYQNINITGGNNE